MTLRILGLQPLPRMLICVFSGSHGNVENVQAPAAPRLASVWCRSYVGSQHQSLMPGLLFDRTPNAYSGNSDRPASRVLTLGCFSTSAMLALSFNVRSKVKS